MVCLEGQMFVKGTFVCCLFYVDKAVLRGGLVPKTFVLMQTLRFVGKEWFLLPAEGGILMNGVCRCVCLCVCLRVRFKKHESRKQKLDWTLSPDIVSGQQISFRFT